ncbi:hypothetical protein [Pedobacter mucosus]|uniref:hypothetical protein n=1 Tax=Pedobacter mucosus TaxID=2895286 RepID=UPI001EE3D71F|nr:hypothetical protein [Pedobacter mucosus]UKT66044.1 hypothetical protein LOK61_09675 [Pedobacter mucosus]
MLLSVSRILTIAIGLLCLSSYAFTAEGCYVDNGPPRIYYRQQSGSDPNPRIHFFTSANYSVACPTGASSTTTHASVSGDATNPRTICWADYKSTGTNVNNAGEYNYNGRLVIYTLIQCPIDDYIPIFILLMAFIGAVKLRLSFGS